MKGFCEECRDYVDYTVKEVQKNKEIRGKDIKYTAKVAYCNECQSEIFISELRDKNLESLDRNYRLSEDLIQVSEIKEVLEKYDIGKRPLSLVLGWGEGTLSRYVDGDIPTRQYSDVLKRVKNDPEFMLELLEKAKGKITDRAYSNCLLATQKVLADKRELMVAIQSEEKIDSVVKYIIYKSVEITPLALQKLLYFSQSFFKAFTGEFLFDNDCEAWIHGPVYKNIYFKYKDHGYNPIDEDVDIFTHFDLTETEKTVIDAVILNFGCYSGKILENMTHAERPWRETRNGLEDHEPSDRIIEKHLIESYFKQIREKYNMINVSDIRDYSRDLFEKIYH
ncbi:type II TA system antitoxin MqsA family protein [Crassaminicella indica]|uniref:DUF4065 domain-containing protein n=1 Tax=Crassaminicella indica TaxID=2855394 RepID=A0ABX8R9Q8_9CLOT|nr:type II TA system antitoxin MqsA family protein [Crassaminicella indica]QXM05798.1 DUF4065 domain-containing protein [Crassaminicella indica]